METESEWTYLKELIQNLTDSGHVEYYIGLSKVSGKWRWLSENESVPEKKWRWQSNPSGDGECAIMYKNYGRKKGYYNDLSCSSTGDKNIKIGFICERKRNDGKLKTHYSINIIFNVLTFRCYIAWTLSIFLIKYL